MAVGPRVWDAAGMVADRVLASSRSGLVNGNRMEKLASVLDVPSVDELYLRLTSTWPDPQRLLVTGGESPARLPSDGFASPPERMMLADLQGYLPDDILTKVDRATMGASLEARAPLLDHRVVEFAWRLPIGQKIRSGEGKWLLRRILERHVPHSLTDRPKQGFGVPIDAWLRGPLLPWAQQLLSESRLRREGYLRPEPVRTALAEHLSGRHNRQHQLWNILMFEAWLDDQAPLRTPA
jgi:asparagine synthase (glutamine-hydrolysing)